MATCKTPFSLQKSSDNRYAPSTQDRPHANIPKSTVVLPTIDAVGRFASPWRTSNTTDDVASLRVGILATAAQPSKIDR